MKHHRPRPSTFPSTFRNRLHGVPTDYYGNTPVVAAGIAPLPDAPECIEDDCLRPPYIRAGVERPR